MRPTCKSPLFNRVLPLPVNIINDFDCKILHVAGEKITKSSFSASAAFGRSLSAGRFGRRGQGVAGVADGVFQVSGIACRAPRIYPSAAGCGRGVAADNAAKPSAPVPFCERMAGHVFDFAFFRTTPFCSFDACRLFFRLLRPGKIRPAFGFSRDFPYLYPCESLIPTCRVRAWRPVPSVVPSGAYVRAAPPAAACRGRIGLSGRAADSGASAPRVQA